MTRLPLPPRRSHEALERALAERVLVLDGATGTFFQGRDLAPADFGGEDLDGCNEHLVLSCPAVVRALHEAYLDAGADIIETNTFGGTPLVLGEYGLAPQALAINREAARLARECADRHGTQDRPRFVAGSLGPTTRSLSVTGGIDFAGLAASYRVQAEGLLQGGVDLLLVETCQDTLNIKAALVGIEEAEAATARRVPLGISLTIEQTGTMLGGQDVEAAWTSLEHVQPLLVGLNCSTGPEFMTDHLRTLAELAGAFTLCYPNAGLPDEDGHYHESPEHLAAKLRTFAERGWLNVAGGCCGTTPEHVRLLVKAMAGIAPRRPAPRRLATVSGLEAVSFLPENRPLLVGERTNVIGSREFKRLVRDGAWDAAAEVGRRQVRGGAQVIDVCLADPDRDERRDLETLLARLVRKVKAPIMLDSTDADVLEVGLRLCQGKCIVNSINLEDGLERFDAVTPLLRRYGGAAVVGCIDEDPAQGMAVTRQRKLEIALRSHELLTGRYGLEARDLIFDPLVFPAATGDRNYVGSAEETIEGIRLIKAALPECHVIAGISNVSFGLPEAGREVVNSVFLYHCTKAGLDLAIVNSEKVKRYPTIPEEERLLAENLLFARGDDPVAALAAHFRGRKVAVVAAPLAGLPLDERLARHVVEGIQGGLVAALDEARQGRSPLAIVNGPLMAGMDEVGRLFNDNQLIVAEVLQSAEVMKAAVSHLEQFMDDSGARGRGKLLLATVKGDVHDIGKNLVEIILSNNGYEVVNLGIKVASSVLVLAAQEHAPDAIGLSGLLVKSAREMVTTARDLADAGISVPLLVGGAALSRRFTDTRIAPEHAGPVIYCTDATDGLQVMNALQDAAERPRLLERVRLAQEEAQRADAARAAAPLPAAPPSIGRSPVIRRSLQVAVPPDLKRHERRGIDFADVRPFLNEQVLYGRHLGLRGVVARLLQDGDPKALELQASVRAVEERAIAAGALEVKAAWRFLPAHAQGDAIVLSDRPGGSPVARFDFPRQEAGDRLCLADFVLSEDPGQPDYVAAFVTTCGENLRPRVEALKAAGAYLESHALQALAIEGAEAAAEWLHASLRRAWGFPDREGLPLADILRARYRGVRVSFGYPACPRLEDQAPLFALLKPGAIGVTLTEGFMMEPEASVSALVFHHEDARYFTAGESELDSAPSESRGAASV